MARKNNFSAYAGIIILLFILKTSISAGQQTPTFSEYNYNPFIINSAYAGLSPNAEMSISNSGHFNQFEGSPKTFSLSGHTALNKEKMGIGAGIIRDEIGVTTSTNFFGAYSYKIFFDLENSRPYWQHYYPGVLSFGITAGLQQYQDNLLELGITNDPNFAENINASIPTLGFSFLFNHASFYLGFSTPNILGESLASDDNLNLVNPYYGYIGYRFFSNRYQEVMDQDKNLGTTIEIHRFV